MKDIKLACVRLLIRETWYSGELIFREVIDTFSQCPQDADYFANMLNSEEKVRARICLPDNEYRWVGEPGSIHDVLFGGREGESAYEALGAILKQIVNGAERAHQAWRDEVHLYKGRCFDQLGGSEN